MLQPVKHKNTVSIAIDNIGEYIINNLHVGDVLPGEREIAEQLQISRNITREALQHYRTLGIIEAKPKVGSIIARMTPQKAFEGYLPFLAIMEHGLEELAQLRLMLELGTAEIAVENVTAEDIALLRDKCRKMKELYEACLSNKNSSEVEKISDLDLEFHSCLLNLSHNKLVESLVPLVVEFFAKHPARNNIQQITRPQGYEEHFLLVDALEKHDLPAMRKLIRSHIRCYLPDNVLKQEKMSSSLEKIDSSRQKKDK